MKKFTQVYTAGRAREILAEYKEQIESLLECDFDTYCINITEIVNDNNGDDNDFIFIVEDAIAKAK